MVDEAADPLGSLPTNLSHSRTGRTCAETAPAWSRPTHDAAWRRHKAPDPAVTNAAVRLETAKQLVADGLTNEALKYLDTLEANPDDIELRLQFIPLLTKDSQHQAAMKVAFEAVDLEPSNPDAMMA